jgi:hypothetical protein
MLMFAGLAVAKLMMMMNPKCLSLVMNKLIDEALERMNIFIYNLLRRAEHYIALHTHAQHMCGKQTLEATRKKSGSINVDVNF